MRFDIAHQPSYATTTAPLDAGEGEGFVVDLTGPGTFTMQSRSQDAFLSWLIPRLASSATSSV